MVVAEDWVPFSGVSIYTGRSGDTGDGANGGTVEFRGEVGLKWAGEGVV